MDGWNSIAREYRHLASTSTQSGRKELIGRFRGKIIKDFSPSSRDFTPTSIFIKEHIHRRECLWRKFYDRVFSATAQQKHCPFSYFHPSLPTIEQRITSSFAIYCTIFCALVQKKQTRTSICRTIKIEITMDIKEQRTSVGFL